MSTAMSETRTHYAACNLCEAICGLEFTVSGTEILQIKGDPADPLSRGHICPKAVALKDLYEDPDRLRTPMRRTPTGWQAMGWEEAFDFVAAELVRIHQAHGADSIAAYLGNPSVHNYGVLTTSPNFLAPLKTRNRFSATSVDQLPLQLVVMWMYGHQFLVPVADIDRSQYLLVLGANPMASNGSLMTVPDFRHRLKALQARGGKLVVLDPRRSETAEVADEHFFISPGTDAAFLIAFIKLLITDGLVAPGRLAAFSDGLDNTLAAFASVDVDALAAHCGIALATIRRLVHEFVAADGAAAYGRMGISVQQYGTLCNWLIQLINVLTGNLDRAGGTLFTHPALDLVHSPVSKPGHFNKWQSRVRGLPEFGGELPVAVLAEEIETPGLGQVKALITVAGNPALSTPNGRRLETALESLEFMLSVDFYLNETTRHATVILPPTMTLEHDHYDIAFHHFAVHNTARFNTPLFDKPESARHDWEIFHALGERITNALGVSARPALRPDQIVDMGLQFGPYQLSIKQLAEHPHGIDLGPLKSSLPERLFHSDKRIKTSTPELLADLQAYLASLASAANTTLRTPLASLKLIGRRHVRSNNSWMHNSQRLIKGPARHQLLMHPADLAARGIVDGARVSVQSRVGMIEVEVAASETMMPGVVSLPHGFGHDRTGTRLSIAEAHAGASNNDLTDTDLLDSISGNAALNGVPVEVTLASAC